MRVAALILLFCLLQKTGYAREPLRPVPFADDIRHYGGYRVGEDKHNPEFKPPSTGTPSYRRHWISGDAPDSSDSDSYRRNSQYDLWIHIEPPTTTTTTTTTTLFPPPAHRYTSVVKEVLIPTEEEAKRCIVRYSVKDLTHGKREFLVNGIVSAMVDTWSDKITFISRSDDQRPKPRGWKQKLSRWLGDKLFGSEERYIKLYPIPSGCYHHPVRAKAVYTDEKENWNITAIIVRYMPEVTAIYEPSPKAQLPLLPDPSHFGRNYLKDLGHCLFAAAFTTPVEPHSLSLAVSQRTMKIRGKKEGSTEFTILSENAVSCSCRPTQPDVVSWWVQYEDTSYPHVIVHLGREHSDPNIGCADSHIAYVTANEVYQPFRFANTEAGRHR